MLHTKNILFFLINALGFNVENIYDPISDYKTCVKIPKDKVDILNINPVPHVPISDLVKRPDLKLYKNAFNYSSFLKEGKFIEFPDFEPDFITDIVSPPLPIQPPPPPELESKAE
jgi:hypothetical protein